MPKTSPTMQLNDYFKAQKNTHLNQNEKFFLYEKIISQKDQKTFARTKYFVSIKSFAYGFAMIILFIGLYGVYFFNGDFSYEGFMVKHTINQVNADYIAKVVDFNGNFYIKHEGKYYKTSNISNGDQIILKKGAEIVFNIDSSTKAKIIGPAKFSLDKIDNKYKLLLSQGDFIQVESLDKKQNSMEVVMENLTISSNQNMNFQITKEDNQYKINNQGEKLTVTQSEDTRELQSKQLLTIKDQKITTIENIEDFGKAITQKNVSQTFALAETKQPAQQEVIDTLLQDIDTKNAKIENPELAQDLGLIDDKTIPTTEQTKTLHSLLNNNFVLGNIEGIYKSHIAGDTKENNYNKGLLKTRIQKIYKLFDLKYDNSLDLIANINQLKQQLTNKYHIPNKYTNNLDTIVKRIQHIQKAAYGSTTNIEQIDQLWKNLETNTPDYLILK